MSLPVVLGPDAARDVETVAAWYEEKAGSGAQFVAKVQEVLDRIGPMPESHAVVYRDLRRARVPRFPYNLCYRVLGDRVEILAVVHNRRDPSAWKSRA